MPSVMEQLGLNDGATLAEVKARWRQLSLVHHPDRHGGDSAEFNRLARLFEKAKVIASRPIVCPMCGGDTFIATQKGFLAYRTTCPKCNGSGTIKRES
jgi:DnaJ-class molecular chaperone